MLWLLTLGWAPSRCALGVCSLEIPLPHSPSNAKAMSHEGNQRNQNKTMNCSLGLATLRLHARTTICCSWLLIIPICICTVNQQQDIEEYFRQLMDKIIEEKEGIRQVTLFFRIPKQEVFQTITGKKAQKLCNARFGLPVQLKAQFLVPQSHTFFLRSLPYSAKGYFLNTSNPGLCPYLIYPL